MATHRQEHADEKPPGYTDVKDYEKHDDSDRPSTDTGLSEDVLGHQNVDAALAAKMHIVNDVRSRCHIITSSLVFSTRECSRQLTCLTIARLAKSPSLNRQLTRLAGLPTIGNSFSSMALGMLSLLLPVSIRPIRCSVARFTAQSNTLQASSICTHSFPCDTTTN